jgi:predicted MFS family arabinose efflux permease
VLAVALVPAGVPIAPFFAQIYGLIGALAPDGTETESTTWLATGIGAGLSSGSALGGALIGLSGPHASFALAAAAALAALLVVRGSVGALRPPVPSAAPAPA